MKRSSTPLVAAQRCIVLPANSGAANLAMVQRSQVVTVDLHVGALRRHGQCANPRATSHAAKEAQRVTVRPRIGEPSPLSLAQPDVPFAMCHQLLSCIAHA